MDAADFTLEVPDTLARAEQLLKLERELAEEAARVDIECYAHQVPSTFPQPVYDTSTVDTEIVEPSIVEAYRKAIERAVRYLDLRELLVRPVPDMPQFVAFKEA